MLKLCTFCVISWRWINHIDGTVDLHFIFVMWTQLTNRTECVNVSYVNSFMTIWSRASSEDECIGISFYGSVEPRVHAIYIHVIFTYNADWSAVLFNKRTCRREGKFSSLFCNTIYRQILHILMKNSENRIWVMYNIKVHYVQVTEPCSVYLPRKTKICRSFMRSNRLYLVHFIIFSTIFNNL